MQGDDINEEVLPERSMPQVSIRFMLCVIATSAVVMWTVRGAFYEDWFWAKCVSVALGVIAVCFMLYILMFALASMFATLTGAVVQPLGYFDEEDASFGNSSDGELM